VAILAFWVYAAGALLRKDVLPDFWTTPPPDMRTISAAEDPSRPTVWELSIAEDSAYQSLRPVGRAVTESLRKADGGLVLKSHVWFDSGGLLKGTPFAPQSDERLDVLNTCEIDASGNLRRFDAKVLSAVDKFQLLTLEGEVVGKSIVVNARGPSPLLNWSRTFDYEPRSIVQNALGPIDRIPGLQIGQRWETKVVSPITGRVEVAKVEVRGQHAITWDNGVVTTLEMVQYLSGFSARTWVRRSDGLVLRQEVPFPFVKLILERQPDRGGVPPGVPAP
jgi:hypothetical protein